MQGTVTYATGMYYKLSIIRYTFLILDTYHPDTLYLCEQEWKLSWLFFEAKRDPQAKNLANTDLFNSLSFGPIIQNMWTAEIILFPFSIFIPPPSALCHRGSVSDGTPSFLLAASRYIPPPPPTPSACVIQTKGLSLEMVFARLSLQMHVPRI
jgi:hypothetical protein